MEEVARLVQKEFPRLLLAHGYVSVRQPEDTLRADPAEFLGIADAVRELGSSVTIYAAPDATEPTEIVLVPTFYSARWHSEKKQPDGERLTPIRASIILGVWAGRAQRASHKEESAA